VQSLVDQKPLQRPCIWVLCTKRALWVATCKVLSNDDNRLHSTVCTALLELAKSKLPCCGMLSMDTHPLLVDRLGCFTNTSMRNI
jgi:hypothetical protein